MFGQTSERLVDPAVSAAAVRHLDHDRDRHRAVGVLDGVGQIVLQVHIEAVELDLGREVVFVDGVLGPAGFAEVVAAATQAVAGGGIVRFRAPVQEHLLKLVSEEKKKRFHEDISEIGKISLSKKNWYLENWR